MTRPPAFTKGEARTCEICGQRYGATYAMQRTCGYACGVVLRRTVTGTLAQTRNATPKSKTRACKRCGGVFSNARRSYCSAECRAEAACERAGVRVMDLYRLACSLGLASWNWRRLLVAWLRERDGDDCQICHGEPIDWDAKSGPGGSDLGPSIDHIMPKSYLRDDDPVNLRLAHWGCNRKRGNDLGRYVQQSLLEVA